MKSSMNFNSKQYAIFLSLIATCMIAQAQTYSPYTPAQINEFNNQALSPAETPEGPIYLENQRPQPKPQSSLDAHYFSQPIGEEEAEAQESSSAAPFTPIPSTFKF